MNSLRNLRYKVTWENVSADIIKLKAGSYWRSEESAKPNMIDALIRRRDLNNTDTITWEKATRKNSQRLY